MNNKCSKCKKNERRSIANSWCNECHAKYMRLNRAKHSDLTETQRKKANARSYANVYKQRGRLIQENCKECGDPDSQMHHEDYDKPLDVIWLCRDCHLSIHNDYE